MKNIKAVVYHAPGDIRNEMIPLPVCGKAELLVKVDACAVCGTDLKASISGNPRILAPKVMGHEFTGVIDEVGAAVSGFARGERVVMATSVSCGVCAYCQNGWNNLCADVKPMGFSFDGGMAEYVVIPELALRNGHVIKVPAGIKAEYASLAEPLSCAVNSLENCELKGGETVVVIGAGPMGIMNGVMAREFGAAKVILAEVNPERLKQGEAFGFDLLVNPQAQDLAAIVKAETKGLGADVVIVAAPAAAPQEQALALVRKRGVVCLFASLPAGKSSLTIDSRRIHYGEIKVVGTSDSTPKQVQRAVDIIARGGLPVEKLVTHVLELFDITKSFELMKSGASLRVVLKP